MKRRLLCALRGEPTDRRPLWIMRQAGRYLPEYRALRKEHTFEELADSAELSAEVTLQPLNRFPLDGAIIFADLMSSSSAIGVDVHFDPGPVVERPIRTAADVRSLPEPEPEAIGTSVIEALRLVAPQLADEVTLLGFAGAPLTLACYLVQGRGVRGFPMIRALAAEDPATFEALLARIARLSAAFLIEQHRAGAAAVQVFDSWGGLFAKRDWDRLVRPHLASLLEELGRASIPRILYFQDGSHLIDSLVELPCECLSLDWRVDLAALRQRLGPADAPGSKALQGNIDPAILLAGAEPTRAAAEDLLARVPRLGHVVNLGHGILPQVPIESVQALIDVVHSE